VTVPAVPSAPPGIADRLAAVEGALQTVQKQASLGSALGDIVISSLAPKLFFDNHKDDGTVWKLCNGQAETVDLTGRYPRGYQDSVTPALGKPQEDSVGPHEHPITVPNPAANGASWTWSAYSPIQRGGDRTVIGAPNDGGIGQASIRATYPD